MKVCILGGGLTGLTAAYALSPSHEVDLLEKQEVLGGCLSSYRIGSYSIESFYHHCFESDTALLRLIDRCGLSGHLEWLNGSTGSFAGGTLYPMTTPFEILKYPYLTLTDTVRLAVLTKTAGKISVDELDDIPAHEFVTDRLGPRVWESFFEPLLNSKFGDRKEEVSAAWLVSRIAIRSNRGFSGERLGYIRGGFQQLIDSIVKIVSSQGCRMQPGTELHTIDHYKGGWKVNGEQYDCVLSTIPLQELAAHGGPVIPPVPYQGAACMTLGTDRDVCKGIYWINMKDRAPYGAVVAHTNFVPIERYGEHIVYLASYFTGMPQEGIADRMKTDFCTRFGLSKDEIHWERMAIDPNAGPLYVTGYRRMIPEYESHGLFVAGMFSRPNYPERSMEGSVRAGFEVADHILQRLT